MLPIELEQEDDGRWIAEIVTIPGALAYGDDPAEAVASVEALSLRILADRVEHDEPMSHISRGAYQLPDQ